MFLKLTDFGFSTKMEENEKLTKRMGSLHYISPEMIKKKPYDTKIDIWEATVVFYVLLVGKLPYPARSVQEMIK